MKAIMKTLMIYCINLVLTFLLNILLTIIILKIFPSSSPMTKEGISDLIVKHTLGYSIMISLIITLIFYVIFKVKKLDIIKEWKINKLNIRKLPYPVIVAFSFSMIFSLTKNHLNLMTDDTLTLSLNYYNEWHQGMGQLLKIISLLVVAPIFEEIIFRGIIYTRLEKEYRPFTSIVISGFLFGSMHLLTGDLFLAFGAIFMGMLFSYIFYKTQSLFIVMICHSVANLPDFILNEQAQIGNFNLMLLTIFLLVVFIFSFLQLNKIKQ